MNQLYSNDKRFPEALVFDTPQENNEYIILKRYKLGDVEIKTSFKIDIEIYEIDKPPQYLTLTENSSKEDKMLFLNQLKKADKIWWATNSETEQIRKKCLNNEFDYDGR